MIEIITPIDFAHKQQLAAKAFKHELFIETWMLERELNNIRKGKYTNEEIDIRLAKKGRYYAGVALYYPDIKRTRPIVFPRQSVICFVKGKFRKQGIGTELIKSFGVPCSEMKSWRGKVGSDIFWRKIGTNFCDYFVSDDYW